MEWFNLYGLGIITIMMIPNIICAIKNKDSFITLWKNKFVYLLEQIGRFGCFGLMIINIPYTYYGFWFNGALYTYICVNTILLIIYCIIWIKCFYKDSIFKALSLSITPSLIFLFSSIILMNIPLLVMSLVFAPCHIIISYKNASLLIYRDK